MSNSESATVSAVDADTRRYATFLPSQIAEGISFMYLDEEDVDADASLYTDFESSWEFVPAPVTPCAEIVKEYQEHPDGLTEAQIVIWNYLQPHAIIEAQGTADVCRLNTAEEPPIAPNKRDSSYTLAVTYDGQSTIDLEKRPEPEIHATTYTPCYFILTSVQQLQGLEMIEAGHCTPGSAIRCQRPGCTDVLRDPEALKFHLHIHNIGDLSDFTSILSAHTRKAKKPGHSSTESSPLNKTSIKVRNRSKSIVDTDSTSGHSRSTHTTRKVHAKDPSFTPSQSKAHNRSTIRSGLGEGGYHDSIAMVLSRPASPVQGAQEALGSDMNMPLNFLSKSSIFSPPASPTLGEKVLSRATSPKRAFSPARALSPIRDGLRRVLSFGCVNECNE
ncbi:hypothetical protein EDB19DRAFT_1698781 [Suillus lakei]|nr:hypothetical protein EDB19DRAFT_1698781 [Suillus lakei]